MVYNLNWQDCRKIARRTCYSAGILLEDREDFVQDVLVEMMKRARRDSSELSAKEMWRAARCVRSRYWRAYKKAKRVLSLNSPVRDTEVELHEIVADRKAPDLDALLDAKSQLESLPPGVIRIGKKLAKEDLLTHDQQLYLSRFRKGEIKQDKSLHRLYWERRAQGLCVCCGEGSGSFSMCRPCRERHRAEQKKYRDKKGTAWIKTMRDYWRGLGRCRRCGEAPEPGPQNLHRLPGQAKGISEAP